MIQAASNPARRHTLRSYTKWKAFLERKVRQGSHYQKKMKVHWRKLIVQGDNNAFSMANLWCFPLAGLIAGQEENLFCCWGSKVNHLPVGGARYCLPVWDHEW